MPIFRKAVPLVMLVWLALFVSLNGQSGPAKARSGKSHATTATKQAATKAAAAKPAAAKSAAATAPATQTQKPAAAPTAKARVFDLTKQPTLFAVGYAHLDTEWRWDYPTTIREYLPKTVRTNFDLLEKYPHYVFNFSGANRYRMLKEYYPQDYAKVKKYVAAGRWFPSGSSMEENDVNSPSAESIIRQILYGKQYFRREFGKTSAEFMLPDCFGFPASLPSILVHTGITGFSTQKLSASWQPAAKVGGPNSPEKTPDGIPFNVGIWEGPDGKTVLAALNPGSYSGSVTYDWSKTPEQPKPDPNNPNARVRPLTDWPRRIDINGKLTGVYADFAYYGTGDTGGSPTESSVMLMESIVTKGKTPVPPLPQMQRGGGPAGAPVGGRPAAPPEPTVGPSVQVGDGPVKVVPATAEDIFLNIKPSMRDKLPRYKGDLELINHSAGSITSEAYMKRWNRQNEVLADDAERASVIAEWLGGRRYPLQRLNDAWTLVMSGQFHDIIPGTSIPKAYEYAWNDQILASNQFASVVTDATTVVASALNTQAKGTPVVVFNPLNLEREDLVEAAVNFPGGRPRGVRVTGPDGKEIPAQLTASNTVLFVAKLAPVAYAVFDVQASGTPSEADTQVSATSSSLENPRYRIKIDQNGDVAGIFDKSLNKELLSAPARLEIKTDNPKAWPAWNMDYEDQMRAPRSYVSGPAKVRVVETGPVRVAVEITRQTEGSTFVQTIRLSRGDAGKRVEFANAIDWATKNAHLKAVFPLTAVNKVATYNWDIGTIERPTDEERQFEVASHQWVDLTDASGAFGATLLTDCKIASDKPNDGTLRLTLIRTPGTQGGYEDQGTQDIGHHEFVYGLAGHAGDFRKEGTDWQGERLNQPMLAFETTRHDGRLGKSFSMLSVSDPRIRVLAFKKAEASDEFVVRMVELDGRKADNVRVSFAAPVVAVREVNGAEEAVGPATVAEGALVTSFGAFQPRTFAVKLSPPAAKIAAVVSRPVTLPYNQAVASHDGSVSEGNFDGQGRAIAAEMLPAEIPFGPVTFKIAPTEGVKPNALTPRGQTITLPAGQFTRLYVLAAATTDTDQSLQLTVGGTPVLLKVPSWGGYVGQWDNRIWKTVTEPAPATANRPAAAPGTPVRMRTVEEMVGLTPGYTRRSRVAWFASHRHDQDGSNDPYAYSYLYAYTVDVPRGVTTVTLPWNERVRILAMTASSETDRLEPAQPLYDTLERPAPPAATTDK